MSRKYRARCDIRYAEDLIRYLRHLVRYITLGDIGAAPPPCSPGFRDIPHTGCTGCTGRLRFRSSEHEETSGTQIPGTYRMYRMSLRGE